MSTRPLTSYFFKVNEFRVVVNPRHNVCSGFVSESDLVSYGWNPHIVCHSHSFPQARSEC